MRSEQPQRLDRFICAGLFIYLATVALEGPLRFVLAHLKIATLLYARDLIAVAIITLGLVNTRPTFKRHRIHLQVLTYLLVTIFFISILMGNGLFSGLFAIKILGTFLLGVASFSVVFTHPKPVRGGVVALFSITLLGVIINRLHGAYPWEGGAFESAFGTSEISRVWWIQGGERRLAGFTRASTLAAAIIGTTGAILMITARQFVVRASVFMAGLLGIYLTTNKGLLIAYGAIAAISFFPIDSNWRRISAVLVSTSFFIIGLTAPFIAWMLNPGYSLLHNSPHLLTSFADRVSNSWPRTIHGFHTWYQWLIGQGLGSIGTPAAFSSKSMQMTVVDNLSLFLMGNFGIVGVVLFAMLFARSLPKQHTTPLPHQAAQACIILIMGFGIVSNILDDGFLPIALGIAWGITLIKPEALTPSNSVHQSFQP